MALEVEFGIPGEVTFSYVHIKGTPEELGRVNYEMLGALFTSAMFAHKSAEKAAITRLKNGETALPTPPPEKGGGQAEEEHEKLLMEQLGATKVEHKHTFRYDDDNKGHSGSFCECGEEEPDYKPEPVVKPKKKQWEQSKPKVTVDIPDW